MTHKTKTININCVCEEVNSEDIIIDKPSEVFKQTITSKIGKCENCNKSGVVYTLNSSMAQVELCLPCVKLNHTKKCKFIKN